MADVYSKEQLKQLRDEIVTPLKKYLDEKFSENKAEHATMQATLTTPTGDLVEIKVDVKRLDEERKIMFERQKHHERTHVS